MAGIWEIYRRYIREIWQIDSYPSLQKVIKPPYYFVIFSQISGILLIQFSSFILVLASSTGLPK